jgi:hypothetical protein
MNSYLPNFPELEKRYNEAVDEFNIGGDERVRSTLEGIKIELSMCLNDSEHGSKAQEYYNRVQKLLNS